MGKQSRRFKVCTVKPPNARAPWVLAQDCRRKEASSCFSLWPGTSDAPHTSYLL